MTTSWFLVLIPTKEYEARLQNLNIVDSVDEIIPPSNDNPILNNTATNPSSKQAEICKNSINNNADDLKECFADIDHAKHYPPMQIAQHDLNKANEDLSLENTYFEVLLQEAMQILNVSQATYQLTKNKKFYLVSFCMDSNNVEASLICLQNFGIGNTEHTSISVIPTSIHIDLSESISGENITKRFQFLI